MRLCRQQEGHRAWRRLRTSLESSGHIKSFSALLDGPKRRVPKTVIQLLKPFKMGSNEADDDDETGTAVLDRCGEMGFDWQVVGLLVAAGGSPS